MYSSNIFSNAFLWNVFLGMKQYLHGATISDMQLTWTGCTLIAIDSLSQLFLYRLSPITDPGEHVSLFIYIVI